MLVMIHPIRREDGPEQTPGRPEPEPQKEAILAEGAMPAVRSKAERARGANRPLPGAAAKKQRSRPGANPPSIQASRQKLRSTQTAGRSW